jgi:hypothetical protein
MDYIVDLSETIYNVMYNVLNNVQCIYYVPVVDWCGQFTLPTP